MTDFWLRIAIAVPVIIGIWTLFQPEMLLGWLAEIWNRRLPRMLQKPIYDCPPCMSSVHGSWIWLVMGGSIEPMLIIFCLALCGFLTIISRNLL